MRVVDQILEKIEEASAEADAGALLEELRGLSSKINRSRQTLSRRAPHIIQRPTNITARAEKQRKDRRRTRRKATSKNPRPKKIRRKTHPANEAGDPVAV